MSQTGILLVVVSAVLTMAANLMLRSGIDAAGGFSIGGARRLLLSLARLFVQPLFALGFGVYFVAAIVWFRVVATEPLSLAYPILVSLTFSLVTLAGRIVFSERFSARKVVGLLVILAGILIISLERSTL
jgi:multidrug transporter EmrE-like cation transporter